MQLPKAGWLKFDDQFFFGTPKQNCAAGWRFVLWLPPIALAICTFCLPETFLDSPYSTVPHEGSILIRWMLLVMGFAYVGSVLLIRLLVWMMSRFARRSLDLTNFLRPIRGY